MSLLARYQAGEHVAVYEELLAGRGEPKDADAVARAMMRIVRKNLSTLADRWRERGFTLANPFGAPGAGRSAVDALEAQHGPLPATLRALYREFGFIDFVEQPPDDEWPDIEELDPLQLLALGDEQDDEAIHLFLDPLMKFDISGVGSIYVPLPASGFDAELFFEDMPVGHLVPYLREAILVRGGFGMKGSVDFEASALSRALTNGLLPF